MDNSYSKDGNINSQPEPVKSVPAKMPKNLRQVGSIGSRNKVIYVEDYVMTYIKQLSDKEHSGCKVAVLMGYYVRTEDGKNIFIKGALEMEDTDFSNGITLSDEGWTSIYENIKKYFSDVEIVGWSVIGPGFFIESEEKIRKVHMNNFQGHDKVLLKIDSLEKEEAFYINENNQLVRQTGYYIYYEKNEEMQNYMVDNKETPGEEKNYTDHTTRKIRNVIQEKKEVKDDRSVIRLLYAASTLLAIIVLVIAATMLDNYDKMRNMETALNTISQSLQLTADGTNTETDGRVKENQDNTQVLDNDIKDAEQSVNEDSSGDTKTSGDLADQDNGKDSQTPEDDQEAINVETVKGNIEPSDETKVSADDKGGDSKADNDSDSNTGKTDTVKTDEPKTDSLSEEDPEKTKKDATPASAPVKYYIVRAGDSLAAISFELYHTFSYMDEIKELNEIEDENKIYEGQKLIVP